MAISSLLADRLIADATGADALPLLAFTLSHLYQEFAVGGSIGLQHYEAIGGVAGSINLALKQVLAKPNNAPAIPTNKEEQLAALRAVFIPWLARIDPESGHAARRVARISDFAPDSKAMLNRLVESRLLVADQRSGADVVEIAHESLLRQWPMLTGWLLADAEDLKIIDGIERAASEWERNEQNEAWLDHRSERLIAAERVSARPDFTKRLDEKAIRYLQACREREIIEQQKRLAAAAQQRRQKLRTLLTGSLAILAIAGFVLWELQQPLEDAIFRIRNVRSLTADQESKLKPLDIFQECTGCPVMIVIPAGVFKMGSPDSFRIKAETPQHEVTINRRFAVGQYELTFDEWDACVARGYCRAIVSANGWGRGRRPVINVSWSDVKAYVAWLSRITGKPYGLLTEAQWEYAARANKPTLFHFGNDETVLGDYAWYAFNAGAQTHLVGNKMPNPFGLFDVYGNVWEWVEDCHQDDYRGAPTDGSAVVGSNCQRHVIRGGSWQYGPKMLRSASRDWAASDAGKDEIGVRLARSMSPPSE
jgi:formylglycine-generating enzyme required for sulfatase activity